VNIKGSSARISWLLKSRLMKWCRRWRTRPNRLMRVHRLSCIRFIDKPLLFVSEVQRSGGNLMSRLFDGHPQVDAHPHELWIGRPNKYHWPKLDLRASPRVWFRALREDRVLYQADTGVVSPKRSDRLPFLFSQNLQQEIFLKVVAEKRPVTQRQVLDCYITSYFNAWLDYQGQHRDPGQLKYWSVFTARMAVDAGQCARFFADYPDGYLISVIRNPLSWFASARRHWPAEYGEIRSAVQLWQQSTQACIRNHATYPERVVLLDFDALVGNTAGTMRCVCERVGLDFHETMTRPTFNGLPIAANSSFKQGTAGEIIQGAVRRGHDLSADEVAFIKEQTDDSYRESLALTAQVHAR
jgi:hypothetical protein